MLQLAVIANRVEPVASYPAGRQMPLLAKFQQHKSIMGQVLSDIERQLPQVSSPDTIVVAGAR